MERDLKNQDIEDRLRDEYARFYGHDPEGNWILIVHADDTTDIYRFDSPDEMWCCELKSAIHAMIDEEVRALPQDRPRRFDQISHR